MNDPVSLFLEYSIKKDYKGAQKVFEKLVSDNPTDMSYLFQLANVHGALLKNYKKSCELLIKVLKKDPKHISARYNLAHNYLIRKEFKNAIKELSTLLKFEKSVSVYKLRAQCYERIGNFKKSTEDYKRCLETLEKVLKNENSNA